MATSNSLIGFTFSNRAATVWPELDKRDRRFDFLTGEKKSLFALHDVLGDGDGDGDGDGFKDFVSLVGEALVTRRLSM